MPASISYGSLFQEISNNFCQGWDVVSTSPPCCQNFIWLEFVQDLNMLSRSLWVRMCISHFESGIHCFTGVMYYLKVSQSSYLLFHWDPWVLRVWFRWGHCIYGYELNVSYSLQKFSNLPKHDQYHSGIKCTNTRVFWRDFTFRPEDKKTEALHPLLVTPWNWR